MKKHKGSKMQRFEFHLLSYFLPTILWRCWQAEKWPATCSIDRWGGSRNSSTVVNQKWIVFFFLRASLKSNVGLIWSFPFCGPLTGSILKSHSERTGESPERNKEQKNCQTFPKGNPHKNTPEASGEHNVFQGQLFTERGTPVLLNQSLQSNG